MTIPHDQKSNKKSLTFIANSKTHTVTRQVAKSIAALVKAGSKGITAQEVAGWAFRLGAYVFTLRHEHGLTIITLREKHEGGHHGRHVLKTPVIIVQ